MNAFSVEMCRTDRWGWGVEYVYLPHASNLLLCYRARPLQLECVAWIMVFHTYSFCHKHHISLITKCPCTDNLNILIQVFSKLQCQMLVIRKENKTFVHYSAKWFNICEFFSDSTSNTLDRVKYLYISMPVCGYFVLDISDEFEY